MGFLALFIAYAMRVCLSIAITEMVVPEKENDTILDEGTCPVYLDESSKKNITTHGGTYEWSQSTQVR